MTNICKLNNKKNFEKYFIIDHKYKIANIIFVYLVNYKSAMVDQL